RIGELVWSNDTSLRDWRKVIKRLSLRFEDHRALYHLPYHKGDRFYSGNIILHMPQRAACPVALLRRYVIVCDVVHGAKAALFLTSAGDVPTRLWFDRKFFATLSREFGGHSARAGGATFYA
ncbi:hypothetical protein CERSUDRAFT_27739, partial [Gelatoporia subvermispora B]